MDDSRITAKDALELLREALPGASIERDVRSFLIAGLITGRSKIANLKATNGGALPPMFDWAVPAKIWKGSSGSSHLNLRTGRFHNSTYGIGYSEVELIGVTFDRRELLAAFDLLHVDAKLIESDHRPPLSDAKLKQWWDDLGLRVARENLSDAELTALLGAQFPDHSVSRDRFRAIRGSRKPGPKPRN